MSSIVEVSHCVRYGPVLLFAQMATWFAPQWNNEGPLGEGGQGWTFLVRRSDGSDQKRYVLKRLKNKDRLARFEKEIEALKKLSHPGILKIIETGNSKEAPFFVAEYCEGGDLSKADMSAKNLLQKLMFYRQICDVVAAAHNADIIHRDLKPQNILVRNDDSIAVGDFGLCLDLNDVVERFTLTSEAVGARYYIAPEFEDGRVSDPKPASDVYSLGKLLYFILSGKSFAREQYKGGPNDLRTPGCETGIHFLYEIFDKTIQVDLKNRYQHAPELLHALDGVIMKIERNAHVLDVNVPQRCLFCVTGQYGSPQGTATNGMMLVCANCGNIQKFVIERASKLWWKSG
jgi:serine/threonine protein kinase